MMKIVTGYTGQAHVTSDDAASFNRAMVGAGKDVILAKIGSEFEPTIAEDQRKITVGTGDLVMDGVHARITTPETVQLAVGTQNQYRIDLIVAHYTKDASTAVENVSLELLKGTAGSSAVEPDIVSGSLADGELEREAVIYKVLLYGNNIESVEKVLPLFYPPDTNELYRPHIKGDGSDYASVYSRNVDSGSEARIVIEDSNKNEVAGLSITNTGKVNASKGNKSYIIPIIQQGTVTINTTPNGSVYTGNKTITFPLSYMSAPTILYSVLEGGSSSNAPLVSIMERTATGFKISISYGFSANRNFTISWVAIGSELS